MTGQAARRTAAWALGALIVPAIAIRFFFWAYTHRTWEDALITVLHAENLFQHGQLSHLRLDGKVVHGFTSPISVLIPILGGALDLKGTYALPFIKFVSALCGGLTLVIAYKLTNKIESAPKLPWLIVSLAYLAFEHHQILWGMAGMETQMVVATIFFTFYACAIGNVVAIGLALGLALYARPDYAFLNVIVCIYSFFFVGRMQTLKAVAIGAALYAPWLIFTTAYYGSPIPNTVFAKAYGYGPQSISHLRKLFDFWVPLGPSFAGNGSGYWRLWDNGVISVIVAVLFSHGAWRVWRDKVRGLYVPVWFVVVYWAYYVLAVNGVFGWYVVPVSAATVFVAGYGLTTLFKYRPRVASAVAALYAAAFVTVLPTTFKAEHDIQANIEAPVRQAMAQYLNSIMRPQDRVGMESLGYSSYYTRHVVIDYPGLINPDVVAYTKKNGPTGMCPVLGHFMPEFLALRGGECRDMEWVQNNYIKIGSFETPPAAAKNFMIEHNVDTNFGVFRRVDVPTVPPPLRTGSNQSALLGARDPVVNQTTRAMTGAPLRILSHDLSAAFSIGGQNRDVGAPPLDGDTFGSYAPLGDSGTGAAILVAEIPAGARSIALPIVTGPAGTHAEFKLVASDGSTIAELRDPAGLGEWLIWSIPLPSSFNGGRVTIEARDNGAGWGEWVALGTPHAGK